MAILSIRISEDLKRRLDWEAERTGLSRSEVARRILEMTLPPLPVEENVSTSRP